MDKTLTMEQLFDNVIAGASVARPITYWHFLESLKANNLAIIATEGLEERVARAIFEADWPNDNWDKHKPGSVVHIRYMKLARAALKVIGV